MAAHDVAGAAAAPRRQLYFAILQFHSLQLRHAAEHARRGLIRQDWQTPGRPGGMKYLDLRRLSFLAANPDLLEQVIETNLVVSRYVACAAIGGVDERAGERVAGAT